MLGGQRGLWSWIIPRFVGRNQIFETEMQPSKLNKWDGISMMTRRHREGGIYQQPEKVPSPATLDYTSARVQDESHVFQVPSQEHLREKGRSIKKVKMFLNNNTNSYTCHSIIRYLVYSSLERCPPVRRLAPSVVEIES